ncbi:unnamed protein product [Sphagnum troendelagicum]|uniref:Arf-GAP domain-containing protein n=1 Tax=Sphagnum troendelagicum TaxID=128251 RepID=A0ABP0TP31_9BRYO
MGSRVKEDERHEMILRKLVKNGENRKCINCGSLGPQYACTNFSTFVCAQCSGVHREFSHRIKSISMAKFTAGEVQALQAGGNEHARELYFKDWDPVRNPLPDNRQVHKLRTFIKAVYVERRYTGERPQYSKGRQGGREDGLNSWQPESWADQMADVHRPYGNSADNRRNNQRARKSDVERSQFDLKRSPLQSERDHQIGRRSYDERDGHHEGKAANEVNQDWCRPESSRSSSHEGTSPPIHPVKDILGEDPPSLHVGLHKDGQSNSPGLLGSGEVPVDAAPQLKRVDSTSLIDFSGDTEPAAATKPISDPFAPTSVIDPFAPAGASKSIPDPFSVGVQGGSVQPGSTGWATFDVPDNGPKQWDRSTLWGDSNSGAAGNTWATFQGPEARSAAAPAQAPPIPQPSLFAMPSAPQLHTQNVPQLPMNSPGLFNIANSSATRVHRDIPQEFFAPAYPQSSVLSMQGQPQANTQPPRTRNPFESGSAPVSLLNLNALYEALPPQGMPLNRAPPQWGQPIPQFPPNAIQGGFGYGNYATPTMVMPTVGPRGFSTGAVYGGPQFFSQTAGSNPFH